MKDMKKGSEFSKLIPKGEIIFKEGQSGDCAYLVESGQVELYVTSRDESTPLSLLGPGEIFGEMSMLDGSRRETSAKANTDVVLSVVSKEALSERIDEADPIVRLLINMLAKRTRETLRVNKSITQKKKLKIKESRNSNTEITDINLGLDVIQKIRYEKELHEALENNEFKIHFQPIVSIESQNVVGFEALTRWNSPEHGLVRPDIFMGIAEETSLIVPLGHWITETACREFGEIQKSLVDKLGKIPRLFCSINVSGRQMQDPKLFEILQKATWLNKIHPKQIKLEITERVFVDGSFVYDWISKCREKGYSVALDDFGTGYSSLSSLHKINANNLKVDKSFVQSMEEDHDNYVIAKSIVDMARGLNKTVIAEGIETKSQLKMLKQMGCKYGQGYLFSRPMEKDQVIEFLTRSSQKKAA
ncbi:MAG: diguanylate phosphodiesterase [Halobacteriovoraceae bacterium]|nr:diguanylate phosphodiesterase [Halobacteriovoraceae bacterium]|tara:strand:+ start:67515 stop:68768 length:1254 start_codon:yes stop_codon:yes gene_type:complete